MTDFDNVLVSGVFDERVDPLLALVLTADYGAGGDADEAVVGGADWDTIVGQILFERGPYQQVYAAAHAIFGPAARRATVAGLERWQALAIELIDSVSARDEFSTSLRFTPALGPDEFDPEHVPDEIDPEHFPRAYEPDPERVPRLDELGPGEFVRAVSGEDLAEPPPPGVLEGPNGVVFADTRPVECPPAKHAFPAECTTGAEVCIRPIDGDMVTMIRRWTCFRPDAMFQAGFGDRLKVLMDPRSWSVSTAQVVGGVPQAAGWVESRPVDGFQQGQPLTHIDHTKVAPIGASWPETTFYELVWPGFNDEWGVILDVAYKPDHPQAGDITVDYRIREQILEPDSGFGEDRPVGPNLMPLTRDDGYLQILVDPNHPGHYFIDMHKELDFQNIWGNKAFDTIEETIPLTGQQWFEIVQQQFFDTIFGNEATAALEQQIAIRNQDTDDVEEPYGP